MKPRHYVIVFIGSLGPIVLLILIFHALIVWPFCCAKFDKKLWHQAKNENIGCVRGVMYSDLKWFRLRYGTPRAKVFALLGTPEGRRTPVDVANHCYSWSLGQCSELRVDYDTMQLCFGANDALQRVSVRSD